MSPAVVPGTDVESSERIPIHSWEVTSCSEFLGQISSMCEKNYCPTVPRWWPMRVVRLYFEPPGPRRIGIHRLTIGRSKPHRWLTVEVTPKTRFASPPKRKEIIRLQTTYIGLWLGDSAVHKTVPISRHVVTLAKMICEENDQHPQQNLRVTSTRKLSGSKLQYVRNNQGILLLDKIIRRNERRRISKQCSC